MDKEQQEAFEEAVERKNQAAQAKAQELEKPATTADDPTPHHKSQRHGQVTAENWNQ
jgi:hypothetical protein